MDREARLIEQFSRWEERGRGWAVWPYPVDLEPPFRPFFGHYVPPDTGPAHDDTRRAPSKIGAFLERWAQGTPAAPPASVSIAFLEDLLPEPVPEPASTAPYVELSVTLPPDAAVARDTAEALLIAAASCHAPVVFEVIGNAERIIVQFAATEYDAPLLRDQLTAFFPAILVREGTGALANAWQTAHGRERLVVEFGLARAFMVPLECPRHFDPDPLLALTAALADLRAGEVGVLQVLL
ncbi:MAG TPA: hypothetical protein VHL58_06925, partial [Thermoanaerobaculia bacterium]|nr:hypothetical protein [Thermoanaerobaculia bacterium]